MTTTKDGNPICSECKIETTLRVNDSYTRYMWVCASCNKCGDIGKDPIEAAMLFNFMQGDFNDFKFPSDIRHL